MTEHLGGTVGTPFEIGHTYYLPHHNPTQVSVPCPVCYGKKEVVMILGNGEFVTVQCEGCGLGYEEPRGYIMEYTYEPCVSQFKVESVYSMYGGEWCLKSTGGEKANWTQLHTTEESAREAATTAMQKSLGQNIQQSIGRTKRQREQSTWTVAYHEKCIRDWHAKIEWHRSKVSERRKGV
jgi:hypothetical protein